jgi:hypothetical protein
MLAVAASLLMITGGMYVGRYPSVACLSSTGSSKSWYRVLRRRSMQKRIPNVMSTRTPTAPPMIAAMGR